MAEDTRSALVLGARNLGRAIIETLRGAGWNVAGVARSDQTLDSAEHAEAIAEFLASVCGPRKAVIVASGLTAGIATKSLRYAHEFAQRSATGLVNVNLPTAGLEFQMPFGGNKESGVGGREQGPAALDFYSAWKTISIMPM